MLKFFSNGTITESKLITGIKLQDNHDHQNPKNVTVTQFKGATVVDPNLGNYVVLDFTVTDAAALDIDHIILMNNEIPVADSMDKNLRIVKEAGKNLKVRLAAQFEGAEHCKFNTTSVNLPYATSFRDGVVRFANVTTNYGDNGWNITDKEDNKSGTVYSADVVDKKISQVTSSLGNLDQYAKKATENTFAENNTFEKDVAVYGTIRGEAVATLGMNVNARDAMVVSLGYADDRYLSKTDATSIYLTQENATATYLTKTEANAAANNYAKLNGGNTFTGDVNTFKEVSATKFSGSGVVTSITTNTLSDSALIPTDGAVKTYVDNTTGTLVQTITALQNKDNNLQSQIDGINAGQNLADIVNNTTELAAYDISHLKAKDDQHGAEGATWAIGDKVQVLGGGEVQSSVYELIKGQMPEGAGNIAVKDWAGYYWRYIGVYGTNAYTKSEVDTELAKKVDKTQITTTISDATATDEKIPSGSAVKAYVDGELANKANSADVYSKTEADDKFAVKNGDNTFTGNNTFNGIISGTAVTSDIATDAASNGERLTTCAGVSSFVNTVVDNKINDLQIGSSYLKLTSTEKQTVASNVDFNGTISGTAVATRALESNGTRLPTEGAVVSFVNDKLVENRSDISNKNQVGAMGLFLYTGGDYKEMGTEVAGTSLQAVGMQLPMDGVVSWSQGAAMEGQWKLLNNTIAGEPCLVLAIRVG